MAHGEFDFERLATVLAGHRWNIGNQIIRTGNPDQLVKIESVEVPAAFIPAESLQLHAARLHSAKGPVAHGLLLAGSSEKNIVESSFGRGERPAQAGWVLEPGLSRCKVPARLVRC